jgi:transposase
MSQPDEEDEIWPSDSPPKSSRRRFSAEYKERILREAAQCKKKGELGALLRREGLYPSHLAAFRTALGRTGMEAVPQDRVPKRHSVQALLLRVAAQERELVRWRKRAERAETLVRLQKKSSELIVIREPNVQRSWLL